MIPETDIKRIAAEYAETIIEDSERFFNSFDRDKDKYTPAECTAIVSLMNLYCNVKTNSADRTSAIQEQKKILAQYRQCKK